MTHQPDDIIARNDGPKFKPHPEGTFTAVCVDVIDLGERLEMFGGKIKIQPKCALVFATGQKNTDTGEPFYLHPEFSVSMHEKAKLRAFLGAWRGKSYTEEQADQGAPLKKLVGKPVTLTVEHKTSPSSGRTYANILAVTPAPVGVAVPSINGYVRADFWQKRKDEYAAEVAKHRAAEAPHHTGLDEMPPGLDENDDDLPF